MRVTDRDGKKTQANRITVRPGAARGAGGAQGEAPASAGNEPAGEAGAVSEGSAVTPAAIALLTDQISRLARDMNRAQLRDYVELTHKPWLLIWRSFISGLSRGIGIALGFTFFAATIVWILQLLGALNLPIVGDYIADIVRIVHRQLEINPY